MHTDNDTATEWFPVYSPAKGTAQARAIADGGPLARVYFTADGRRQFITATPNVARDHHADMVGCPALFADVEVIAA